MHREEREIKDRNELIEILKQGKYTVLSLCRDNEPYVVTLSYGYDEDKNTLYFHCALEGLKIDFIAYNPNVCGTVIEDRGYVMNECSHAYRSVVFWGKMYVIENLEEKKHAMEVLLTHLEDNPDPIRERNLRDEKAFEKIGILRLDVQEISGKRGE